MTCSRKSTTWSGRALLAITCALTVWVGGRAAAAQSAESGVNRMAPAESTVRQAITEAVKAKMGHAADVRIENLRIGGRTAAQGEDGALLARPEPGARLGRTIRFSLSRQAGRSRGSAVGYAVATVYVAAAHARSVRAIERGETIGPDDVVGSDTEVGAVLVERLPLANELVGTRVLRDIAVDEVLSRTAVALRPTVQSGDAVAVRAGIDGVTAETAGVAEQSGGMGDVIRVVNPSSRRSLKARVVAPGKVEVVQ